MTAIQPSMCRLVSPVHLTRLKRTQEFLGKGNDMEQTVVDYRVDDGVATVTLNRPDQLDAMTGGLMSGITSTVKQIEEDSSVRVLVLTGHGRGFCAGADLVGVAGSSADKNASTESATDPDPGDTFNTAMRSLMNCPVPTIARVNGAAAGGGFGLAMACDITVASRSAFFVATFGPNLGIVPDMGTTWNIPLRVGRARALGISLLGDRISAQQAEDWGLIWQSVPDEDLDAAVSEIAEKFKRASPDAVVRIRETINESIHNSFSSQLDLEMEHQAVLIPKNMKAGAQAFLEKRVPTFSGDRRE